jgi:ATP-binding cassette subfamily B protein
VPLERWDLEALRGAVGVVQQDVMLFSGTIADNVALYRQGVSEETIEHALRDAQLLDRVQALGGLGARLSERGGNLSVGERQLLSIARVLAYDPPVVILDEATANIDSATEQRLQAAMDRVFEGRTVVVVAHRLATIRKADRIVCLQHGRLVEQGTHDTLLAAGGLYAELIEAARRQSATSDTSADGVADASLADGGERPAHGIDTAPHQGATRTERDQHE